MGLMTDLFVSTPERAATYDAGSAAAFDAVQLGGLTNLEFETLWAILDGEDWDPDKHVLIQVAFPEDSAAGIFQFPPAYVDRLRSVSDEVKRSAAAAWARTEEMDGSSIDDCSALIDQLIAVSRSAMKAGQGMFVWCCP